MTARDTILASIRRSLGVSGREAPRRKAVADRLREHPGGIVPARGRLAPKARAELFRKMVEAAAGSIEEVPRAADVPGAVAAFLRAHNLPMALRRGADPRLEAMPWARERTLEVKEGPSRGGDLAAVDRDHAGTMFQRDRGGAVGRGVHHSDLVDQPAFAQRREPLEDRTDRALLVSRR